MVNPVAAAYARDVMSYLADSSTTEETYYPPIRDLWKGLLESRGLPFPVRTGTSESRHDAGGADRPDVAIYDRNEFVVALGEVKLPTVLLQELAVSTDRDRPRSAGISQEPGLFCSATSVQSDSSPACQAIGVILEHRFRPRLGRFWRQWTSGREPLMSNSPPGSPTWRPKHWQICWSAP